MEVYLIRHTTPDQKIIDGVCYGQNDVPLADTFENETEQLKARLPPSFDAVYSSPLTRCMQLAACLTTKIKKDNRLLELNFGEWEMKRWDEIENTMLNKWMNNFVEESPPHGESFAQLQWRVSNFFQDLQSCPFKTVAVVTHAGVIRSVLAKQEKMDLRDCFKIQVSYGSVRKIIL